MSKPLPPVKPPEKLPHIDLLTIVRNPDKDRMFTVVLVRMQGDKVIARKVASEEVQTMDLALDEYNRLATRIFLFDEGDVYAEAA